MLSEPGTLSIVTLPRLPDPDPFEGDINPSRIRWGPSTDHGEVETYLAGIYRASDDVLVQVFDLGLGVPYFGADRETEIDVTGLPDGDYYAVLRAVSGEESSDPSGRSAVWRVTSE